MSRRGGRGIPARTTLLGGWALLLLAAARSQFHGTDQLIAALASLAAGIPVLLAATPLRRPGARRPVAARAASGVAAGLGLLIAVAGVVQAVTSRNGLWAEPGLVLAVVAGVALLAGGAVRLGRLRSPRWPRGDGGTLASPTTWGRRKLAGVATAVAVLIALPILALAYTHRIEADSTTAAAVAGQPVPRRVTRVSWHTPLPARVTSVVAGSAGPITIGADGVRAYHGSTGKELWHYLRTDVGAATVTPDHRRVVVRITTDHGISTVWRYDRYLVLDSATGAVTADFTQSYPKPAVAPEKVLQPALLVGDGAIVVARAPNLVAFDLISGRRLWQRPQSAPACSAQQRSVTGAILVQRSRCPGENPAVSAESTVVQGISFENGQPVWTRSVDAVTHLSGSGDASFTLSPDGSTLVFAAGSTARWLLDTSTGANLVTGGLTWDVLGAPIPMDGHTWLRRTGADGAQLQLQAPRKKEVYRPSTIETPDYLFDEPFDTDDRGWANLSGQLLMLGPASQAQSLRPEDLLDHPGLATVKAFPLRAILGDLPARILPGPHVPGAGDFDRALALADDPAGQVVATEHADRGLRQYLVPAPGAVVALVQDDRQQQLVGLHNVSTDTMIPSY